jgi:hypothetical protein
MSSTKLLPRFRGWYSKLFWSARRLNTRDLGRGACNWNGEPSRGCCADEDGCHVWALWCFALACVTSALGLNGEPSTFSNPRPKPM